MSNMPSCCDCDGDHVTSECPYRGAVATKMDKASLAHKAGKQEERARIVAWLRTTVFLEWEIRGVNTIANKIERGEHLK